ncbi:MAG TPA: ABC transporter ATP-binding protein [Thermodesulforhabdus norvegica]|uniref:ABC transporter ATP-binding protein n=1 Tax=Thermodesulforhabdus norvegica TaxID=39841 RepID=A0A7C0WW70_9BACT|nr:ABC transporter ATP-binding protein [Thermodesulforhabdus norvegica]
MASENILEVRNVTHRYGDFIALKDVTITVPEERLTALIGPNGAGKTTFYNVVSGKYRPSKGSVIFNGVNVTGYSPHKLSLMGLSRSFQITNIFHELTVIENVMIPIALHEGKGFYFWTKYRKDRHLFNEAMKVLSLVGLEDVYARVTRELSYGDRRLVEIAIVLAGKPQLVLLDEPTAGMTPEETEKMIHLIKNLATTTETTFFFTEHDMNVVFSVAEYIYVLHQGELLAQGKPEDIRADPKVREAYLGGSLDT